MKDYSGIEIAVIGMSGKFPGAKDLNEFWDNLKNGYESVTYFTDEELAEAGVPESEYKHPDYVKANSFLENKENFDADFFGYRPEEARLMDPQIRLFHEECWKALEDAGIDIRKNQDKVGLFAGGSPSLNWETYAMFANEQNYVDSFTASQLKDITYLCARVSYLLNLQGPAFYLNTACSTSLVAIQRAVMSLLLRECKVALAGGVSLSHSTKRGYFYEEGMVSSNDGHCRTFDEKAIGTIRGEGVGVVALKRYKDAVKDGDHIYAVIRGASVNNDGSEKMSFTAPSEHGQYKAILKAYNMAKVDPATINMVEAHGSGTPLGDPIEIEALNKVFGKTGTECAIGSVKTNIGHLDAAAGVAGFIKTVLSLKHKHIPASLHYESPNPKIDFEQGPFFVNTKLRPWEKSLTPRRAGVSSFGMGGTNAHIVLEECPENSKVSSDNDIDWIKLSAHTADALKRNVSALAQYLEKNTEVNLSDVAYTFNQGRADLKYRKSIVFQGRKSLLEALSSERLLKHPALVNSHQSVPNVFMFAGQGAEYVNMCKTLYHDLPIFKETLDNCFEIAAKYMDADLKAILFAETESSDGLIHQTNYTHPILFAVEYALAKSIMSWGVKPDMVIGHSLGEYVAACLAGAFDLESGIRLIIERGKLMKTVASGAMMAVSATEDRLNDFLKDHRGVTLATANSTELQVVAGDHDAVQELIKSLEQENISCRLIAGASAYHSHHMNQIADDYRKVLATIEMQPLTLTMISNVDGQKKEQGTILSADYWVKHLVSTVKFKTGIDTIMSGGDANFVEIGPGIELSVFVRSNAMRHKGHKVVAVSRHQDHDATDFDHLYTGIGKLWEYGIDIDWSAFYKDQERHTVSLPVYSFDQQQFPAEVDAYRLITERMNQNTHTVENKLDQCFYTPVWETSDLYSSDSAQDNYNYLLVFAEEESASVLINTLRKDDAKTIIISKGNEYAKIDDEHFTIRPNDNNDYKLLFDHFKEESVRILYLWSVDEAKLDISGREDFISQLEVHYYPLINIAKSIDEVSLQEQVTLISVTNNLHQVFSAEQLSPAKSLQLAAIRILSKEFQKLACRNIDVDILNDRVMEDLAADIESSSQDVVTAYRHQTRFVQRMKPIALAQPKNETNFVSGKTYLIAGGTGGMGMNFARYITSQVSGVKLILTGRSELLSKESWKDDKQLVDHPKASVIQSLVEIEKSGSEVFYYQADVSDISQMQEVVQDVEQNIGTISGVIHAAGGADFGGIVYNRSREDDLKVMLPKAVGAIVLNQLLENRDLDFFILCSSTASIAAPEGEIGYVAANLFLNAYAKQRSGQLTNNVVSINWNHVRNVGMANEAAKVLRSKGFNEIVDSISAQEAGEVLERSINSGVAELMLSRHKLSDFYEMLPDKHIDESQLDISDEHISTEDLGSVEEVLLQLWHSFFGKPDITIDDDFFDLGGDSLKALTLIGRINKALHVKVSIKDFLNHSDILSLSTLIEERLEGEKSEFTSIPKAIDKELYALSAVQRRLYFVYQLDKSSLAYNSPKLIKLEGQLDKERLQNASKQLFERHSSLRTTFVLNNNEPYQKINDSDTFQLEVIPSSTGSVEEVLKSFVRPFDLEKGPLLRISLFEESPEVNYLLVDMHHIITDGSSQNILISDFLHFYNNDVLPELPVQYVDFAEWQQKEEQQQAISKQKEFWLEQYADEPSMLDLPIDKARSEERSYIGATKDFMLTEEDSLRLRKLADQEGVTMYVVLLAAYKVFLSKLCNQEDIIIGSPSAGRNHPDLENVIGMFINTLPIRSEVKPQWTFRTFLQELNKIAIACFDNQDFPLDELVEELKLERETGRNPLFDVEFVFKNYEETTFQLGHLKQTNIPLEHRAAFELILSTYEMEGKFHFRWEYTKELFLEDTIDKFTGYFKKIVEAILADTNMEIGDYEILENSEKSRIIENANGPVTQYPSTTVISYFESIAEKYLDHVAVQFEGSDITYQELNEKSNALAIKIREGCSMSNPRVALLFEPSIDMIIAMLAVLKTGGSYLPLSPSAPQARTEQIVKDSNCQLLLSQSDFTADIKVLVVGANMLEGVKENPERTETADDSIYIIYTSGTTGEPKGVEVTNKGVMNFIYWRIQNYGFSTDDHTLQLLSYHFDGFASNLYASLLSGGKLTLVSDDKRLDTTQLFKHADLGSVTNMVATPGLYGALIEGIADKKDLGMSLRFVVLAGEKASPTLINRSQELFPAVKLHNEYGPTEASIGATFNQDMHANNVSTIGQPVANTSCYILGKSGELLPWGNKGELCIGGDGLAIGYINQPDLNQEKFVNPKHLEGLRVYRTGDLARYNIDGTIEYLGRVDNQIKIRGFRVELEEISKHVLQLAGINDVYLDVFEKNGEKYISAYCASTDIESVLAIKGQLENILPPYMVPAYYAHLSVLPLTNNGKVDVQALKEVPFLSEQVNSNGKVAKTDLEKQIANIWKDVLKIDEVRVEDRFFDIGGTSLNVIKLKPRIEEILGKEIDIMALFKYPTIEKFIANVFPEEFAIEEAELDRTDTLRQGKANRLKRLNRKN
ncbi:non-ribosomal peptide synthetase/type I polyketide synthase [Fulvivirga sediminis]|uniref:Amino acid adenylation domain-containing protein n=1 Tax=Fulvivirga sediminis TaxID=2803949 RepID=A0A937FAM7_9BACT|nr:non-ribosomal peptide synthetase/type I polyketide synthase [Fulvivirga sediminis]MBL3658745.1 amino acid adenylation domain-containing protein [Fulvivirga sediminis]